MRLNAEYNTLNFVVFVKIPAINKSCSVGNSYSPKGIKHSKINISL